MKPNYCCICNRQLSDGNALKVHFANNLHKSRALQYEDDPESIIGPYSHRLAQNLKELTEEMGGVFKLKDLYEEYVRRAGRRGGIVFMEATRWKNIDEVGVWMQREGHGEYREDGGTFTLKMPEVGPKKVVKRKAMAQPVPEKHVDQFGSVVRPTVSKASGIKRIAINASFEMPRAENSAENNLKQNANEQPKPPSPKHEIKTSQVISNTPWIAADMIVRLNVPALPSYHLRLANIVEVRDQFGAVVEVGTTRLLVDQDDCMPYFDAERRQVILDGEFKGKTAIVIKETSVGRYLCEVAGVGISELQGRNLCSIVSSKT